MEDFIKVESLEHALELNGETLERFNWRTERDSDGEKAGKELEAIAKAINNGKVLKVEEFRYWPVFIGSGSDFLFHHYDYVYSSSHVCARLTVNCGDAVIFFGKQHLAIWQRYIEGQ